MNYTVGIDSGSTATKGILLADGVMNKFHVNIPESARPTSVAVVRGGKTLDTQAIQPAIGKPTFTVQGAGAPNRAG